MAYSSSSMTPLLSAAEEITLAKTLEAGLEAQARIESDSERPGDHSIVRRGAQARCRFMEANLRLVLALAAKAKIPAHVDRDDLIRDGMLGLERAVTKFDRRKGYKFSTYATWWIRQAIQRPTRARLARDLTNLDSIDRSVGDTTTIGDLTATDSAGPEARLEAAEDRRAVHELLAELDTVTAYAVAARFGLDVDEPATFTEIGSRLGVSPEAARRRVTRALGELRRHAEHVNPATDQPSPSASGPALDQAA